MQELFIAIGKTLPFMSNVAAILGMLFCKFYSGGALRIRIYLYSANVVALLQMPFVC
jgi:hypothetical protein